MVSSTFYDLREIRNQLERMLIDELGYKPLISESPMFPIDPDVTTIDNCRLRVEQEADILILIIGRRYGSVDLKSGKSVTNLEYAAARAKGIPIYAFVERDTQAIYEFWSSAADEKKSAIAGAVEDIRLFEFIEQVRVNDRVWTTSFALANDIITSIRVQFAFLMQMGLETQQSRRLHPDAAVLTTLRGDSYRLAVDRPRYWEYLLFAQVMQDEIASAAPLRREYDLHLSYGKTVVVDDAELSAWFTAHMRELLRLVNNVQALVEGELSKAFGPPGVAGSLKDIVFIARQLAKIYSSLISWSQQVRCCTSSSNDVLQLIDAVSNSAARIIENMSEFPAKMRDAVEEAGRDFERNPPAPGETRNVRLDLSAPVETEEILAAVNSVLHRHGLEPIR